jgi:hypothetical protein
MLNSGMINPSRASSTRSVLAALRAWSGSRLGLLAIAGVAIVAGLAFNWSWLVAVGIAPLLLSALPCLVMCALGLCMMQMTRGKVAAEPPNGPASVSNSALSQHSDISGLPETPVSNDASSKVE